MFDMISAISELINNCQCHGGEGAAAALMEDQRLEQELLGETGDRKEGLLPPVLVHRAIRVSSGPLGESWPALAVHYPELLRGQAGGRYCSGPVVVMSVPAQ